MAALGGRSRRRRDVQPPGQVAVGDRTVARPDVVDDVQNRPAQEADAEPVSDIGRGGADVGDLQRDGPFDARGGECVVDHGPVAVSRGAIDEGHSRQFGQRHRIPLGEWVINGDDQKQRDFCDEPRIQVGRDAGR